MYGGSEQAGLLGERSPAQHPSTAVCCLQAYPWRRKTETRVPFLFFFSEKIMTRVLMKICDLGRETGGMVRKCCWSNAADRVTFCVGLYGPLLPLQWWEQRCLLCGILGLHWCWITRATEQSYRCNLVTRSITALSHRKSLEGLPVSWMYLDSWFRTGWQSTITANYNHYSQLDS